ncbi:MAG: hypothetical protein PHW12_08930, partial [Smithella sp.]|nr:hypothetical protein [Smithella sp.]
MKKSVDAKFQPQAKQAVAETAAPAPEMPITNRCERNSREIQELKDRLHFVAKTLSKNFRLRLLPGKAWAVQLPGKLTEERRRHPEKSLEEFDGELLVPEVMTYSEKDLIDRSEDYIFGIFRREVGHLKHSDYRSLIDVQEITKQEGYQPIDLLTIYDAWEDGRSNALEGQSSATAKRRIGAYLREDVVIALTHDFEKQSFPVQYSVLCWAKGAEPFFEGFDFAAMKAKIKDSKVLETYEETQSFLDEYIREGNGRKAFREILWKKGWPVFRQLIDKYVEEEAKRQYEKSENGFQQKNDEG